jgi:hypothetical protein
MTKIQQRMGKPGWFHVAVLSVLLLGFGLTTAAPGSVAYAARSSGGGHSQHSMGSQGAPSRSHGQSTMTHIGGRSSGFGGMRQGSSFSTFRGSAGGLTTRSFANSLNTSGLHGIGRMDYRPLTTRTLTGPRPTPVPLSHVAGPTISGDRSHVVVGGRDRDFGGSGRGRDSGRFDRDRDFGGIDRGRDSGRFDRDRDFGRIDLGRDSGRFDRDRNFGRLSGYRYFDFGRFDCDRDFNRFRFNDFARFHHFGFYRFRSPTIVGFGTIIFPDLFLFGDWFGTDVCWWRGYVCPEPGVTVILQF